ncbi:MAG: hypothetical protein AB7U35_14285 [Sphingobium sp.]
MNAAIHYAKSTTANAAGEGQMDDCIGRLVADFGVDRAGEQAVRNGEYSPFATRHIRCAPGDRNSASNFRTICRASTLFEFSSVCVSFNAVTNDRSRRSTAAARLICAAAALSGDALRHQRERAWESAAGDVAGAILGRSHQN